MLTPPRSEKACRCPQKDICPVHPELAMNTMTQTEKGCGCKIVDGPYPYASTQVRIVYCPTHAKAFEMREFLEKMEDSLHRGVLPHSDFAKEIKELLRAVKDGEHRQVKHKD